MLSEWYLDFLDKDYKPKESDIIALFSFKPARGISDREAIGRLASESSVGTWTTLPGMPKKRIYKLMARAFWWRKRFVKIAYPIELWEEGSVPQLLSGIGGNIFGMKAIEKLKLIDAQLPKRYLRKFKGPLYGKDVIRKIFRRKRGPITSTVIKPKVGYTAREHAEIAYQLYMGGIDCVKDDENLTSQSFNKFEERVALMAKARDKAEKETGDVKDAFMNVTSPTLEELEKRITLLHEYSFRYFMIDVVLSGFTALGTAVELAREYKMAIHGHRAMHAMFTRHDHGMSMYFLAKLMRIIGIDQLHIGTIVGKMEGNKKEIKAMAEMMKAKEVKAISGIRLSQKFYNINGALPVASGGLHPGILPALFNAYGTTDIAIQVGGGVLGHPKGPREGARAVIEAIEAYKKGISLREYAKTHSALNEALKKWGYIRPK